MTTITPGNHPETVTWTQENEFGQYTVLTDPSDGAILTDPSDGALLYSDYTAGSDAGSWIVGDSL